MASAGIFVYFDEEAFQPLKVIQGPRSINLVPIESAYMRFPISP